MKTIIIKEVDKLTSKLHKGRVISEYLIYLMENDVKLECYSEIGNENRDTRTFVLFSRISAECDDNNEFFSAKERLTEINFENLNKQ